MNIYLTFDYELFFGNPTGSVQKCLIEPTNKLIEIAERHNAKMTFFVDCGYLFVLQKFSNSFESVNQDRIVVEEQLNRMVSLGHSCQLHIHPHWEDSYFDGKDWIVDSSRYKLSDFSQDEILSIFSRYKEALESVTKKRCSVYRAGGWCLQPFDSIYKAFIESGIKIDSTVFNGGYLKDATHYFDFRNSPNKEQWKFSKDLTKEEEDGCFLEIPISSYRYSPLFFWKLFGFGRMNKSIHKFIGDGSPIPSRGMKKKYLTSFQQLPVSADGYFATELPNALKLLKAEGKTKMVVIGHPKACTLYSLLKLEEFIQCEKSNAAFISLE